MSWLGIDIGSSQVKAAAFDSAGVRLAVAYRKYQYETPRPSWMELNSRTVLDSALAVIAECAEAVSHTSPVRAIGISSQGEAFTALDAAGAVLAPAMISGDCRAAAAIERFSEQFGKERLYRITGHTPSPMFSLAKLLWLKEERPELFCRAARFLCFEDLLGNALTGRAAMGWPLAGRTMLFDLGTHAWSREILDAAGIPESKLAEPIPSGAIVGEIKPELIRSLHLAPSAVLAAGGHDQVIGALGCGAFEPGSAMYAAGSVECLVPVLKEKVFSQELFRSNLCTYDFALPGRYATLAYSLTGSNMQEYFMREFAPDLKGDYTRLLDSMPPEPTRLLTLPYLTPSGTPWFDTVTPGCVFGWRFDTSRGALLKAFWEGIAFEMRLNVELLRQSGVTLERLIASGGGFRHPAVVQLHADILNLPIEMCSEREAGCRGAALLARKAVEPEFVIPPAAIVSVTKPDAKHAEAYRTRFADWKAFSQNIRNFASCRSQA